MTITKIHTSLEGWITTLAQRLEFTAGGLGAQNAIGGGGRYDYLAEEIGGARTPGIGFALGMDRIIIALDAQNVTVPTASPVDVYLTVLGRRSDACCNEIGATTSGERRQN